MQRAPKIEDAVRKWILELTSEYSRPHALTLTFRDDIDKEYTRACRHFTTRFLPDLNRGCFKNAARNCGKTLPLVPIVEGKSGESLHIHIIFDLPENRTMQELQSIVRDAWKFGFIHLEHAYDPVGLVYYLTKPRTKFGEFIDSVLINGIQTSHKSKSQVA